MGFMGDWFLITSYCLSVVGCGASGERTASGTRPVANVTAACDPQVLPLGSTFMLSGSATVWSCEDTGRMVRGRHVDLFFGYGEANKKLADNWGRRWRRLRVLSVPGRPSRLPDWRDDHSE